MKLIDQVREKTNKYKIDTEHIDMKTY